MILNIVYIDVLEKKYIFCYYWIKYSIYIN